MASISLAEKIRFSSSQGTGSKDLRPSLTEGASFEVSWHPSNMVSLLHLPTRATRRVRLTYSSWANHAQ